MKWKSLIAGLAIFGTMTTVHAENPKLEEIKAITATGKYVIKYNIEMPNLGGIGGRTSVLSGPTLIFAVDGDKRAQYMESNVIGKNKRELVLQNLLKDGKLYNFSQDLRKKEAYMIPLDQLENSPIQGIGEKSAEISYHFKFLMPKETSLYEKQVGEIRLIFLKTEEVIMKLSDNDKAPVTLNCDHYSVQFENDRGDFSNIPEQVRCYWLPSDGSIKKIEQVYITQDSTIGIAYVNIEISGEVSDDMFTIPKGTKVYTKVTGGMDDLLGNEKAVLVEEY